MKKCILFLAASLLFTINTIAQTNKIENTGAVGIGTLSPQDMLSIVTPGGSDGIGITSMFTLGPGSGAYLRLYNAGTPGATGQRLGGMLFGTNPTGTTRRTGAQIQAFSEGAWTDGSSHPTYLHFLTAGHGNAVPSERMRITANGRIGVGTTSPQDWVSVVVPGGADGMGITSTIALGAGSGAYLRLYNEGTPNAANQRLGGMLFGTNPTGTTRRTGAQIQALSEAAWTDGSSQPTYLHFLTTAAGSAIPSERMRITADGNVGIGTTDTKGYKLAVNGDAIFTKVKVKAYNNWPDYVFDEHYKLLPIHELAAYIQSNRHLPGIPSASEVEEDGIDVGEMNKKLLRKIEELTLYLIEEHKEKKAQQEMIEALRSEVARLKAKVE